MIVGSIETDGSPAAIRAAERAAMRVTRRQARLALGEAACSVIDALTDNPEIPWALRESIQSATEWYRTAPEIDELAWVLGLTEGQIDDLFRYAAQF